MRLITGSTLPNLHIVLDRMGIGTLNMESLPYENKSLPEFKRIKDVFGRLKNKNILLVGDNDNDGFVGIKIAYEYLNSNYNVDFLFPENKTHGLTVDMIMDNIIGNNYGLVIIIDSSTDRIRELNLLSYEDLEIIVIDHHNPPKLPYPINKPNLLMINNKFSDNEIKYVSAGFLTYLCMEYIKDDLGLKPDDDYFDLALSSIYSDQCPLSDEYNRSIVEQGHKHHKRSRFMKLFMNRYDELNLSYVNFKYAPIINNIFRLNRLDIIEKLIVCKGLELESEVEASKLLYQTGKNISEDILKSSHLVELEHVVFTDITKSNSIYSEVLDISNYTGIVAGKISEKYIKPAIVVYKLDEIGNKYKCSVRDCFNRNLLNVVHLLNLQGGGHNPAFGFTCNEKDLVPTIDYINEYVKAMTMNKDNQEQSANIIKINSLSELNHPLNKAIIKTYANYNLYASGGLPPIYIQTKIGDYARIITEKNRVLVEEDGVELILFDRVINRKNTQVKFTPTLKYNKYIELLGETIKVPKEVV